MKYDPIMCMMVDDSVKTEDRDPYAYEEIKKDIQMMKSGKASYITKNGLIGRISHSFNNRTPQNGGITKEQKTELMNLVMSAKDEKTIDHAIRSCDISMYERIYQEAKAAVGGKYGIISNLSDLETAINDANRRGEKEDAKKLKAIYKKYN